MSEYLLDRKLHVPLSKTEEKLSLNAIVYVVHDIHVHSVSPSSEYFFFSCIVSLLIKLN